ncbi:major facilitator superfamily domain-containing protein [Hyaloraphidium curvatum]|nr:major facilitator superfamily domain-containing protein [Hyaloraphidium curvatum]
MGCGDTIKAKVIAHYTVDKKPRDPKAIEADRWFAFPPSYYINEKINGQGGQICRIPFNRWALMPAAVIIQMCVGTFYAWSGYNAAIDTTINGSAAAGLAPNTFYIAVACFGPCAAVFGPWMERVGPRTGAFLGLSMYYIGQLLAAVATVTKQLWLLYIGYGIIGGAGLGVAYISPVSPLQKWFPDWRGLASGLAVAGFGAGSIIAPFGQNALIQANGGNPWLAFVVLGSVYWVISMTCALVLRIPPPGYTVKGMTVDTIKGADAALKSDATKAADAAAAEAAVAGPKEETTTTLVEAAALSNNAAEAEVAQVAAKVDIEAPAPAPAAGDIKVETKARTPIEILQSMSLIDAATSFEYRLMYIMLFGNLMLGLTTISKLQDMCKNQFGRSPTEAATINSINSVFNLGGRVGFSLLSDKIGRKSVYLITLGSQAIILGFLPLVFNNLVYWAFLLCIFIVSAAYGSGFGVIPAFLADMFGAKNVGATHGIILTTWSIGGVVGVLVYNNILNWQVSIYGKNAPNVYNINFYWLLPIAIIGFLVTLLIRTNIRDRILPRQPGEIARIRVGRSLTFWKSPCTFERLSRDAEDKLWNDYLMSQGM